MNKPPKSKFKHNLIPQPNKLIKVVKKSELNDITNVNCTMYQKKLLGLNDSKKYGKNEMKSHHSGNGVNVLNMNNMKKFDSLKKKEMISSIEKVREYLFLL